MPMDKFGVSNEVLHQELRDEEARLMQEMQYILTDHTKTASDRSALEARLLSIRNKLTELDTKNSAE